MPAAEIFRHTLKSGSYTSIDAMELHTLMAAIDRPNQDALYRAINIFQDAMRPFILRCLRRAPGATVEETIRRSLLPAQADAFDRNLRWSNDLASVIDVNYFPALVEKNWRDVFALEFKGDKTILKELKMITSARNKVAHPGTQDLETEYTKLHLDHIAYMLGRINAPDHKKAVKNIRAALVIRQRDSAGGIQPLLTTLLYFAGKALLGQKGNASGRRMQPGAGETNANTLYIEWRNTPGNTWPAGTHDELNAFIQHMAALGIGPATVDTAQQHGYPIESRAQNQRRH